MKEYMTTWSDKWLLKFHTQKCKYMRLGNTVYIGVDIKECMLKKLIWN